MADTSEQIEFWKEESWNYFRRNYEGKDLRSLPLVPVYIEKIFRTCPISIEGGSILDIGCTPGSTLFHLSRLFKTKHGVGTEPSPKVVAVLREAFPEFEFHDYPSQALPFRTGEFDLVILRGVIHWVDRNYFMQTLGEAIRTTSRYLLISDFAPAHRYSTIYAHQAQYRTYKMEYQTFIESCGFMQCIACNFYDQGLDWTATKTALFEKIPLEKAFPVRIAEDFQ
ncbi:MAG: class I SAM-dependent methyltransferase [Syntrophaceae bacterium]